MRAWLMEHGYDVSERGRIPGKPDAFDQAPALWLFDCFTLTEDLVNDARDRYGRVNDSTDFRYFFFRSMQPHDQFPFRSSPAPTHLPVARQAADSMCQGRPRE